MDNMQVNGAKGVQQAQTIAPKKTKKAAPQAPDKFEKKGFDIDDAMKFLEESKRKVVNNKKVEPKFDKESLDNMRKILEKTPEKWNSVKTLASTPFLKGRTIANLAADQKMYLMQWFHLQLNLNHLKKLV